MWVAGSLMKPSHPLLPRMEKSLRQLTSSSCRFNGSPFDVYVLVRRTAEIPRLKAQSPDGEEPPNSWVRGDLHGQDLMPATQTSSHVAKSSIGDAWPLRDG
jgi:hypothetical protein